MKNNDSINLTQYVALLGPPVKTVMNIRAL